MWFIVQIALGVALGLLLFRWFVVRPAQIPRWWALLPPITVRGITALLAAGWGVLWILHMILTATP